MITALVWMENRNWREVRRIKLSRGDSTYVHLTTLSMYVCFVNYKLFFPVLFHVS